MSARKAPTRRKLEDELAQLGSDCTILVLTILNVTVGLKERQSALFDALASSCEIDDIVGLVGNDHVVGIIATEENALIASESALQVTESLFDDPPLVTIAPPSGSEDPLWTALRRAEATRQVRWHHMFAGEFAAARTIDQFASYVVDVATSSHGADSALVQIDSSTWGDRGMGTPHGEVSFTGPDGEHLGTFTWWGGVRADDIPSYAAVAAAEFSTTVFHLLQLQRAQHALHSDAMTGLLAREGLTAAVSQLTSPYCLAFVDIDKFKSINDDLGHEAGDDALRQVGALLLSGRRRNDLAARWGGDEFVLVLPDAKITEATERLHDELACASLTIHGRPYTLSVGVTEARPGLSLPEIVRSADQAMYSSKRSGGSAVTASRPA